MDSLQWFILAILFLILIGGMHRRHTRASLIRYLHDDNKSAKEIEIIMKAYEGE